MAGNEGNPPKGLLACDTCYKRKVKCDRKNPCRNCVAAKNPCQWTRQIHVRRRKPNTADAVRTLEHKVHHLETLLRQSDRTARTDRDDVPGADYMEEEDSEPESTLKYTLQQDDQTSTSNGINTPPLQPLRLIDALVRVREAERLFSRFKPANRERESESFSSTDILNAMTRPSNDPTDFIPHSSVNKIGLALLSGHPIPSTETAQYQIIMLFKAALALGQQAQSSTHAVTRHIKRIQGRKLQAALTASDKIGASPSLLLLQAQCVKVAILQFFGHVVEARNIMGSVSRTLVALGYHRTETHDEEVMNCVNWCYRCDRSMSVFARLPPVLPPFEGDVSKKSLYSLQDRVLHLASLQLNTTQRADIIEEIDREMQAHIQKEDTKLDFRIYATLTLLWHSHPDLGRNSHVQTQLTGYARETLKLLNQLDRRPGLVSCEADITLSWDILCAGVLPMLVLSVHTLRENEASDFEFLKHYTSIVSNYNITNHLATQVHRLCVSLVQICEACCVMPSSKNKNKNTPTPTNHTPYRKNFMNFDSFFVAQNHQDPDAGGDEDQVDAMVAEILTLQPRTYVQ